MSSFEDVTVVKRLVSQVSVITTQHLAKFLPNLASDLKPNQRLTRKTDLSRTRRMSVGLTQAFQFQKANKYCKNKLKKACSCLRYYTMTVKKTLLCKWTTWRGFESHCCTPCSFVLSGSQIIPQTFPDTTPLLAPSC